MSPRQGRENCYLSPSSSAGVSSTASHQTPCRKTQCGTTVRVVFNIPDGPMLMAVVKRRPPLEDCGALAMKLSWPKPFNLSIWVVLTLNIISCREWRYYMEHCYGVCTTHTTVCLATLLRETSTGTIARQNDKRLFLCVAKDPCNRQSCSCLMVPIWGPSTKTHLLNI